MFVMCEQSGMTPTTTDLARAASISKSYASEILSGKRSPSRPLAIHIFRATGWIHDSIATLSEEQIAVLEQVERWRPSSGKAAA